MKLRSGGGLAFEFFNRPSSLQIEGKAPQGFVSDADKAGEAYMRKLTGAAFSRDGIVGEEAGAKPLTSGYTWVVDPIDGNASFISGIPTWVGVLAIVKDDQTQTGVTIDLVQDEMFVAQREKGASLNDVRLSCPAQTNLSHGSMGTGYSNHTAVQKTLHLTGGLLEDGGRFFRNASGATSLAYVAAGRLLGFVEEHMNAWDCLGGQHLIAEAGGRVEVQSADQMIADGGRVVVGSAGVFDDLVRFADKAHRT